MNSRLSRFVLPVTLLGASAFAFYLALYRPGYLSSGYYLGGLIFLQVLLAAVWKYEQRFFPLVVTVFLWAGISIPFSTVWTAGRWPVLAVGAIVGFALYMRSHRHAFGTFHLTAFSCVLAALVSASVSSFPLVSSLKALSLLLLFLYGSTGARLALAGREEKFFERLLLFIEILVYLSAISYLILHFPVYGNPNSMGAIMGVIAVPLLFWGALTAEGRTERRRKTFAFVLCVGLLFFSQARSGILAATVTCTLTCVVLRRYRLLLQGAMVCMGVAVLAIGLTPSEDLLDMPSRRGESSIPSIFLYKGKEEKGVLGSRGSLWDETATVIHDHPWFGSGFGTTLTDTGDDLGFGKYASNSTTTREHGDSYLAILEGVGLLGVVPFFSLVVLLTLKVGKTFRWLRRTGNLRHCAVPVAMVLAAGLVHAGFEDWLFAVGYYLCVFFWVLAFAFLDLLPMRVPVTIYRPITDFGFRTLPQNAHAVVAPER